METVHSKLTMVAIRFDRKKLYQFRKAMVLVFKYNMNNLSMRGIFSAN